MFIIKKYEFDSMENEIGNAVVVTDEGILDSIDSDDCKRWIENAMKGQRLYQGWDRKTYPYYTYSPVPMLIKVFDGPIKSGYFYEDNKDYVLTEKGKRDLEEMRSNIKANSQNVPMDFDYISKGITGIAWDTIACIDYLDELGEISLVSHNGPRQDWTYIRKEG